MKIEKSFREKVKLGKFSAESEKFFGNRREIWNRGEMHHCLRGDGPPAYEHYELQ